MTTTDLPDPGPTSHTPQLVAAIESLLVRELVSLRLELGAYPDDSAVWATPPGLPNSGGTLALHLAGNLRHYVGAVIGGSGYVRDREREFAARNVPRSEIIDAIDAAEHEIRMGLARLVDDDLEREFPEAIRASRISTMDLLLHLAVHLAYHLGQVSYHRRLVTGDPTGVGALDPSALASARP